MVRRAVYCPDGRSPPFHLRAYILCTYPHLHHVFQCAHRFVVHFPGFKWATRFPRWCDDGSAYMKESRTVVALGPSRRNDSNSYSAQVSGPFLLWMRHGIPLCDQRRGMFLADVIIRAHSRRFCASTSCLVLAHLGIPLSARLRCAPAAKDMCAVFPPICSYANATQHAFVRLFLAPPQFSQKCTGHSNT